MDPGGGMQNGVMKYDIYGTTNLIAFDVDEV